MNQTTIARTAAESLVFGLSSESVILILINLADAVSTVLFVELGLATEYNPIMEYFLNINPLVFLLAKIATFSPFVAVCEWLRRRDPDKARKLGRLAIVSYTSLYVVMVAAVNLHLI